MAAGQEEHASDPLDAARGCAPRPQLGAAHAGQAHPADRREEGARSVRTRVARPALRARARCLRVLLSAGGGQCCRCGAGPSGPGGAADRQRRARVRGGAAAHAARHCPPPCRAAGPRVVRRPPARGHSHRRAAGRALTRPCACPRRRHARAAVRGCTAARPCCRLPGRLTSARCSSSTRTSCQKRLRSGCARPRPRAPARERRVARAGGPDLAVRSGRHAELLRPRVAVRAPA